MFSDSDGGTAFHMPEDESAYYMHQFMQDPMVEYPLDFGSTLMTPTTTTPNSTGADSPHRAVPTKRTGDAFVLDGLAIDGDGSRARTATEPRAWHATAEKKYADDRFAQQFTQIPSFGGPASAEGAGLPLSPSSADSHRNPGFGAAHMSDVDLMSAYTHTLDHQLDNAMAYSELDAVPGQGLPSASFKTEQSGAVSEPPHQKSALSAQLAQVKAESGGSDGMWPYAGQHQFHEITEESVINNGMPPPEFQGQRSSVPVSALGSFDGLGSPHPSELDLPGSLIMPSSDSGLPEGMAFDGEPMSPTSRPPVGFGPSSLSRNSSIVSMNHPLSGAMPISIGRSNNLVGVFKGTPTYRSRQSSMVSSGVAFSLGTGDIASSYGSVPVKDLTVSRASSVAGSTREDSPLGSTLPSSSSSVIGFTPGSAGSAGGPLGSKDEPKRRSSVANMHNGQSEIECTNCKTKKTPLWRRNPEGEPLCNACGLFLKLHGETRPLRLKSDVIKKRNRANTKAKKQQQQQQQQPTLTPQHAGRKHPSAAGQADPHSYHYNSTPGSMQSPTPSLGQMSSEGEQPSPPSVAISRPPSAQPIQSASHLQRLRSLGHSHQNSVARDSGSTASSPQSASESEVSPRHPAETHRLSAMKQSPIALKPVEATTAMSPATTTSGSSDADGAGKWDWLKIQ